MKKLILIFIYFGLYSLHANEQNLKLMATSCAQSAGQSIGAMAIGRYNKNKTLAKSYISKKCKKLSCNDRYKQHVTKRCYQSAMKKYSSY